jgi:DNA modification methylase
MDPKAMIPCLVLDVTEAESDKLLAFLDPLAAKAGADQDKLNALIASLEIESEGLDALAKELATEQLPEPGAGGDEFDTTPQEGPTRCKPGELWIIGGVHRLLCGDSTKAEDVKRLMGREKAGLMNTDPPYGVAYANDERPNPGVAKPRVAKPRVAKPRVANDGLEDAKLQEFLERVFKLATSSALLPNAAWYMWHAHLTQGYFAAAAAAAAANVVLHRQIIWVKPVLLLGRGQYHWKHEPCFMGWVEGNQPPDYGEGNGERTQTTVWEIAHVTNADRKEFNHSTPKPVGLFVIPMVKHLRVGEIAYEPFSGSGPQFIAAHRLGRRCYGIEIEPRYCDVILRRCEAEGLTVERI